MIINNKRGILLILEILVVVAIIYIMFYIAVNTYLKKPVSYNRIDSLVNTSPGAPSIDTSSYQGVVESSKKALEDINKQHQEQLWVNAGK